MLLYFSGLCVWRVDDLGSAQDLKYYLYHSDTTSEYYLLLNLLKPWIGKVSISSAAGGGPEVWGSALSVLCPVAVAASEVAWGATFCAFEA